MDSTMSRALRPASVELEHSVAQSFARCVRRARLSEPALAGLLGLNGAQLRELMTHRVPTTQSEVEQVAARFRVDPALLAGMLTLGAADPAFL
ncbi:MAG: hypothetical protein HY329_05610 [Chloroflexi bacterium]|nr:hypothetical protein [Chloroflexota bacterium]